MRILSLPFIFRVIHHEIPSSKQKSEIHLRKKHTFARN